MWIYFVNTVPVYLSFPTHWTSTPIVLIPFNLSGSFINSQKSQISISRLHEHWNTEILYSYCKKKNLRGDGGFKKQRTQMQLTPQHQDRDAGLAIGVVSVQDPAASQNDVGHIVRWAKGPVERGGWVQQLPPKARIVSYAHTLCDIMLEHTSQVPSLCDYHF
jgi:hypothetical protein